MKLLFCCLYDKHNEMASLMSRNMSKYIISALCVNHTARNAVKTKFTVRVSPLHRSSSTKPCKTSSECCRACQ